MRKIIKRLLTAIIIFMWLGYGQKYGKIELINGEFIEGKNLTITNESILIYIDKSDGESYLKSEVVNVWKGRPSPWESRKATIIGISIGSFIGIVDGSRDPGAYGMIPFCGIIGYIIDMSKRKYQNVTDNWQLIWSNRELNNQIRSNASSNNKYNEIERLWNLKEKGIITEEEFLKKKKELLGEDY